MKDVFECGTINRRLGGSKVFHCNSCDQISDRDANASGNILIRFCTLSGISL